MHCFKEDTCFLYITFETKYKSASYRDIKKSDHSQKDTNKIRCIGSSRNHLTLNRIDRVVCPDKY